MEHQVIKEEVIEVDIGEIYVNPYQPRRVFSAQELETLADSVRAVGMIHPPVVRSREDGQGYELISGERRVRAADLLGMERIAVLVRMTTQDVSAQAALIENVQRVDLNPIEIAKGLQTLEQRFSLKQEEIAERVGMKRSTVTNYLRLLSLPKKIQKALQDGTLTMGHAKALLSVVNQERQELLFKGVIREGLSVRETEEKAQRMGKKARLTPIDREESAVFLEPIQERLQERLGTKVTIQGKGNKGKITIDYYDLDDLERLIELIGIQENA